MSWRAPGKPRKQIDQIGDHRSQEFPEFPSLLAMKLNLIVDICRLCRRSSGDLVVFASNKLVICSHSATCIFRCLSLFKLSHDGQRKCVEQERMARWMTSCRCSLWYTLVGRDLHDRHFGAGFAPSLASAFSRSSRCGLPLFCIPRVARGVEMATIFFGKIQPRALYWRGCHWILSTDHSWNALLKALERLPGIPA